MGKHYPEKQLIVKTKEVSNAPEQEVVPQKEERKNTNEQACVTDEEICLSDAEKAYIKKVVEDTLTKNVELLKVMKKEDIKDTFANAAKTVEKMAETYRTEEYFKFLQLINKPQRPTTSHLEDVVAGTFIFTVREIQDEPYILQGVVTKADQDYKYTDENETESELYSVDITIRWFAGVPDHFFNSEMPLTDCSHLYADSNNNDVFLTAEEAVSTYLNRKCTSLYWRLSKLQEAQKNSRTATYLHDLV